MIISKEDVFRSCENLPSISLASLELIRIVDNPETTKADIIELISLDEVLLVSLFRLVNSANFYTQKARNVADIVDILGFQAIKQKAIFISAKTVFCDETIWKQSVFLAIASKLISVEMGKGSSFVDDIYMAALFESYGAMALMNLYQNDYVPVFNMQNFDERLDKEADTFGVNHLELAYKVLTDWGIPKSVTCIIKNQIDFLKDKYLEFNMIIEISKILYAMCEAPIEELHDVLSEYGGLNLLMEKFGFNSKIIDEEFLAKLEKQYEFALNFSV